MKNIIFIINDSMRYKTIGQNKDWGGISATPFLDTLVDKSVFANNLFSQGPYTEAAMKALLTGKDLLDDCDYFYHFTKVPNTVFDTAKKNGYETYFTLLPELAMPRKTMEGIEHLVYAECPDYKGFYEYRVNYYIDLYEHGTEIDKNKMIGMFQMEFDINLPFYEGYIKNPESDSYSFVKEQLLQRDVNKLFSLWKSQYDEFNKDKLAYVNKVIEEKRNHILYVENYHLRNPNGNIDLYKQIYKENQSFFEDCENYQKRANSLYGLEFGKLFSAFCKRLMEKLFHKDNYEEWKRYFVSNYFSNWHGTVNTIDWKLLFKEPETQEFEVFPSMKKQIDLYIKLLKERKTSDKPFFIVMHTLCAHHLNYFITNDEPNLEQMQYEIDIQKEDFAKLSKRFMGFLSYRQSVRYIDYCTEYLFSELKKNGLADNLVFSCSADHGSSFGPSWVREEPRVNNFHTENYHIPFIAYDGETVLNTSEYATSKDIFPTIFDMAGLDVESDFTGHSLLKNNNIKIAHSEYMGPGCPDIMNKDIWLLARNEEYSIGYKIKISDKFENGSLVACYNKRKDPNELKNIANKVSKNDIEPLLSYLNSRFLKLKEIYGVK